MGAGLGAQFSVYSNKQEWINIFVAVLKENLQPETFNKIDFGAVNSVPMEQLGNILCAVISKTKR